MSGDPIEDPDDVLAAELAAGLLEGDERAAAGQRLARDAAFAAAHEDWARRLSKMTPAVAPPDGVWAAITARLPANDTSPDVGAVKWWRAGTLIATAAAVLLAILPLLRTAAPLAPSPASTQPSAPAPQMVALLTATTGEGAMAIAVDPATGRMTTTPANLATGDRATELWLIHGKDAPRSLGVVAHDTPGRGVAAPGLRRRMEVGDTLAISLEPAGGSPTGLPTGPVILTGKIEKV